MISQGITRLQWVNSFCLSDATWWHGTGSKLAKLKPAPSHYLNNQCWFVIIGIHPSAISQKRCMICWDKLSLFETIFVKNFMHAPGNNELILLLKPCYHSRHQVISRNWSVSSMQGEFKVSPWFIVTLGTIIFRLGKKYCNLTYRDLAKWLTFCRQHFKICCHEWESLYFD